MMENMPMQSNFTIPVFLIILPLVICLIYKSIWWELNKKNKLYAFTSIGILILALAPLNVLFPNNPMSLHMLGHIILLLIFPPVFLSSLSEKTVINIMNIGFLKKAITFLSNPIIAYSIGMVVMWLANIPMLFTNVAHGHQHHMQHTFYFLSLPLDYGLMIVLQLIAGLIFSFPVYAPVERLRIMPLQRIIYLFVSCLGCTVLGIFISLSPSHMYTMSMNTTDLKSMVDLQISGLLMWVPCCPIYISKCLLILFSFLKEQQLSECIN
jgi:cytochrome c oxidase assembly factor CtaG